MGKTSLPKNLEVLNVRLTLCFIQQPATTGIDVEKLLFK